MDCFTPDESQFGPPERSFVREKSHESKPPSKLQFGPSDLRFVHERARTKKFSHSNFKSDHPKSEMNSQPQREPGYTTIVKRPHISRD